MALKSPLTPITASFPITLSPLTKHAMPDSNSTNEADRLTASFNNQAQTYDRRAGGATRSVAAHIVAQLSLPPDAAPVILDNACGTAAVTDEILKVYPNAKIHAVDGSAGMIEIAKAAIEAKGLKGNVEVGVMDGQELGFADGWFDVSITNFGIFFFPDPERGAREIWRTLKSGGGGRAVVTCWKEPGLVPLLYECQKLIRPKVWIESLPVLERWMERETIVGVLEKAGFGDVEVERFESMIGGKDEGEMVFGVSENLKGIVGGQWSEEEKKHLPEAVEQLLRGKGTTLFVEKDGKRGVPMVAWIATCKK